MFLIVAWWVGQVVPASTLRETLFLSLTPLAVMVGFGLKSIYRVAEAIGASQPLSENERPLMFVRLLLLLCTLGAVVAVLVYSLMPVAGDGAAALVGNTLYFVGPVALLWVVAAFTVLIRLPYLVKHVESISGESPASPNWIPVRKARRIDIAVISGLMAVDFMILIWRGVPAVAGAGWIEVALVGLLYEMFCAVFLRGRTIGKRRLGLYVRAEDGTLASRWRAVKRSIVLFLPLLLLGGLLVENLWVTGVELLAAPLVSLYALGAFHPYGRSFADLLVGTVVTAQEPTS